MYDSPNRIIPAMVLKIMFYFSFLEVKLKIHITYQVGAQLPRAPRTVTSNSVTRVTTGITKTNALPAFLVAEKRSQSPA